MAEEDWNDREPGCRCGCTDEQGTVRADRCPVHGTQPHLTVGRLRSILAVLPAATKVLVHAGWDFPVFDGQDGPHVDSEGLILYLDYDGSATMVNKDWYNAVMARMPEQP